MCTQKRLQKVAFYTFCLIKNAISSLSKVSHISPHPEKCTLEIRAGNRSTSHAICCPKECINLNVFTKNGGKKEIDLPFSVRFACFLFCFLLFLFFYFFHFIFFCLFAVALGTDRCFVGSYGFTHVLPWTKNMKRRKKEYGTRRFLNIRGRGADELAGVKQPCRKRQLKKRYLWVIKVYHNTIDKQNGVKSLQTHVRDLQFEK